MLKRSHFPTLILLLCVSIARADSVDDYVKAEIQRQHLAGISVAVLKEGK